MNAAVPSILTKVEGTAVTVLKLRGTLVSQPVMARKTRPDF